MLIGLSACSGTSASEPAESTTTSPVELVDDGYRFELVSLGSSLRRALTMAPTVGTSRVVDVQITGTSGVVAARLTMTVIDSMADRSGHTLEFEILEADAADDQMAMALAEGRGSTLTVDRDELSVPVELDLMLSTEDATSDASYWLEQLLLAPTAFTGPITTSPIGTDAVWEFEARQDDESEALRFTVVALDAERYSIEAAPIDLDNPELQADAVVVLEGEVGAPLPTRQELRTQGAIVTVTLAD